MQRAQGESKVSVAYYMAGKVYGISWLVRMGLEDMLLDRWHFLSLDV
jgi:GTP cyclohydrolase I